MCGWPASAPDNPNQPPGPAVPACTRPVGFRVVAPRSLPGTWGGLRRHPRSVTSALPGPNLGRGRGPETLAGARAPTAARQQVVACRGWRRCQMEGGQKGSSCAENAENAEFSKPLRFRQTKFYWANRLVSRATPGRSSAFSALHPIGRRSRSASRSCVILRLRAPVRRAPRSPDPFARFVSRSAFADLVHGAVLERRRWLGGHSRHVDPF
jgi:hypothetical protein